MYDSVAQIVQKS